MLRKILNEEINFVIKNGLSQGIYGDEWLNPKFSVRFINIEFLEPNAAYDDEWDALYIVKGDIALRFFSDSEQPIDPLNFCIQLQQVPINIAPDPNAVPVDNIVVKLTWKPEGFTDKEFSDGKVYVEVVGAIQHAYILKRTEWNNHALPTTVVNEHEQ